MRIKCNELVVGSNPTRGANNLTLWLSHFIFDPNRTLEPVFDKIQIMKKIRIISTGGTIDSSEDYDPTKKSVFSGTNMPAILKQARLNYEIEIEPLMQKDSADITDDDRQTILKHCIDSSEEGILITHGTDTMSETARYLGEKGFENKTIVLVGSFVPLSQEQSDAFFNLGYALASVHLLPHGVWVAMGGEFFSWDKVRKNKEKQIFESK